MFMSLSTINAEEKNVILPTTSEENIHLIAGYKSPSEEFGEIGFFVADKRLKYTISKDILERNKFDQIKPNANALNVLVELSKNCWIALNKRELNISRNIVTEIVKILKGEYGLHEYMVSIQEWQKITELKYRCIEQIEMLSTNPVFSGGNNESPLYQRNTEELKGLYELAHNFTNTPYFHSEMSYDFAQKYGVEENPNLVIPILDRKHKFANFITSQIFNKYPKQKTLLISAYALKKQAYTRYLEGVYNNLNKIKYSQYKSVDRGQTSGGHRNTCMFNSVFSYDLQMHNIGSTKLGSLGQAKNYLSNLNKICIGYKPESNEEIATQQSIEQQIRRLEGNKWAEAIWSFSSSICDNKIFPGFFSTSSILETQCHSLMNNFAVFPKVCVRPSGDRLFSHYGTGYYGSENFPIIPVSCSTGHAQSLVLL